LTLYIETSSRIPGHTVTGRIYDSADAEIPTGSEVAFIVRNKNGGRGSSLKEKTYDQAFGYNIETDSYGDCLVTATVSPSGSSPFNIVVKANLSESSTQLDLYQDLSNTTTVTMNGDATENMGSLSLLSPYGDFPAASVTFADPPSASIRVTNPYGYQGFWTQTKMIQDYPSPGYNKVCMKCSDITQIGTSVTLPTIDTNLGPTEAADPATLSYVNGTLAVGPVAGANVYMFALTDKDTGHHVGRILSSSRSLDLPPWMKNLLATKRIRVEIQAMDSRAILDMQFLKWVFASLVNPLQAPGQEIGMIDSASENNWKDLDF
jgi:hypothetical protein